ncbi:MAG: hypothetical protein ACTSVA_08610 [Candidatus Njordarchaeales archaeon]
MSDEENKTNIAKYLIEAFERKDEKKLREIRVVLWLNFLGPRSSFRELRLYEVSEDFSTFAIYGIRIEISAYTFLKNLVAIEIERGYFVNFDLIDDEIWNTFIKNVLNRQKPRVIMGESFKRNFGLPEVLSDLDIYVLQFRC